jgi:hypothetical protein
MNNVLGLYIMSVFGMYLKPIWNSQRFVLFVFNETDTQKERKKKKMRSHAV